MNPADDDASSRPDKQKSFVGKVASKTRARVSKFQPYRTISLLPKLLVRPDSGAWKRFGRDAAHSNHKHLHKENLDRAEASPPQMPSTRIQNELPSPPRRPSLGVKDNLFLSRIISPLNQHFQKNRTCSDKTETNTLTSSDYCDDRQEHPSKLPKQDSNNLSAVELRAIKARKSSVRLEQVKDATGQRWTTRQILEEGDQEMVHGFWAVWSSEVRREWDIFTGETTAHGYKRTTDPHRNRVGRLIWLMAILGVSGIVFAILYNTVVGQDLNSFSSSIKLQPHVRLAFPAVTICSLAPYDFSLVHKTALGNHSKLFRKFLLEVSSLQEFAFDDLDMDNETMNVLQRFDTKELQAMLGWRLDKFILRCYWNEMPIVCSEVFVQSKTMTESCFTFNFDPSNVTYADRVGSYSGLGLLIDVGSEGDGRIPAGLKVLLHEPNEFPNTRERAVLVAPGMTTYVTVAKNEYIFLPRPFKAYGSEYCSDLTSQDEEGSDVNRRWLRLYNYTGYSSCVAECRLRTVLDKCGCVVYGRDPSIPDVPYCRMDQYLSCYIPTLRRTYMQSPFQMPNCPCPLPCRKVEYLAQMSSATFPRSVEGVMFLNSANSPDPGKNYVELKIFYKELFTHIEEHVPIYTWLTIFGNVGGQMGLFTGASVLTVLEFLELLLVLVYLVFQTTFRISRNRWRAESRNLQQTWTPDVEQAA